MSTNLDRYNSDLKSLIELGDTMWLGIVLPEQDTQSAPTKKKVQSSKKKDSANPAAKFLDEYFKKARGSFEREYQSWYTEASSLIRQLIPDRSIEFEHLYKGDGKRKTIVMQTYTIQDWLNGFRAHEDYMGRKLYDDRTVVAQRFNTQLKILKSVEKRFESSLFDIRQLVKSDLMDSELEAATELNKNGFGRGAGVIAGVVLEKHLAEVASNHNVVIRKKHATISDHNDALKNTNIIEIVMWRLIQRLGDIRNLCGHNKGREPTADEVSELIGGVEKITKTLF